MISIKNTSLLNKMALNDTFAEMDSEKTESEQPTWKKYLPWGLCVVFLIVIVALIIVIATTKPSNEEPKATPLTVKDEQLIPFYDPLNESGKIGGAAVFQKKHDILNSKYYTMVDFYNEKSEGSLKIIENFKTYQQTNGCSCACGCAIMVADHYGMKLNESYCAKVANVGTFEKPNTWGIAGTYPSDILKAMKKFGFITESNENFTEETTPVRTEVEFTKYVDDAIDKNEPIIVMHQDLGGHYLTIIGHDTMGTEYTNDDIIILADPYDITDHRQDGYNIWGLTRFYALLSTKVALVPDTEQNYNFFIRVKKQQQ